MSSTASSAALEGITKSSQISDLIKCSIAFFSLKNKSIKENLYRLNQSVLQQLVNHLLKAKTVIWIFLLFISDKVSSISPLDLNSNVKPKNVGNRSYFDSHYFDILIMDYALEVHLHKTRPSRPTMSFSMFIFIANLLWTDWQKDWLMYGLTDR